LLKSSLREEIEIDQVIPLAITISAISKLRGMNPAASVEISRAQLWNSTHALDQAFSNAHAFDPDKLVLNRSKRTSPSGTNIRDVG
jgi:hypothetical protein